MRLNHVQPEKCCGLVLLLGLCLGCERVPRPSGPRELRAESVEIVSGSASEGWFGAPVGQIAPSRELDLDSGVDLRADASAEPRVELSAERMRLDPRARTATLEGTVRLRRAGVLVESARVIVRYGPEGEVLSAEAQGPVTARTARGVIHAPDGARADFVHRSLVLLGRVRVSQGGAVLEAEGATVDLASGAIELQAVRGWLPSRLR